MQLHRPLTPHWPRAQIKIAIGITHSRDVLFGSTLQPHQRRAVDLDRHDNGVAHWYSDRYRRVSSGPGKKAPDTTTDLVEREAAVWQIQIQVEHRQVIAPEQAGDVGEDVLADLLGRDTEEAPEDPFSGENMDYDTSEGNPNNEPA